jgi:transcriptional regulator with XRE-family HTH domain
MNFMRLIEVNKDRLAEKRIKQGLSLKTLADKAGVHYATVNRLENGTTNINPDTAVKVCNALSVDFDEIFVIKGA